MDFAVSKSKIHEEYRADIVQNDIAIVKLRNQVPVNGAGKLLSLSQ